MTAERLKNSKHKGLVIYVLFVTAFIAVLASSYYGELKAHEEYLATNQGLCASYCIETDHVRYWYINASEECRCYDMQGNIGAIVNGEIEKKIGI